MKFLGPRLQTLCDFQNSFFKSFGFPKSQAPSNFFLRNLFAHFEKEREKAVEKFGKPAEEAVETEAAIREKLKVIKFVFSRFIDVHRLLLRMPHPLKKSIELKLY